MLIGYARVSKSDGSQVLDSQLDALKAFGVEEQYIYTDRLSGADANRPGFNECMRSLRKDDTLVVYSIDRLARGMNQAIKISDELQRKNVNLKILFGAGSIIDLSTAQGRFNFNIMSAFAEMQREMIRENTKVGLAAARARGKFGGRPWKVDPEILHMAMELLKENRMTVREIAKKLGVSDPTLYSCLNSDGTLKERGQMILNVYKKDKK